MNIHSYVAKRNSALGRSNPYMANVRSYTATPGGRGANRSLKPNSLRELQPVPTQDVTIEKHTVFYKLLNDVKSMPLHVAIEKAFADLLRCRAIVWTYNKALQKITESYRVSPEVKAQIRAMKRKTEKRKEKEGTQV